MTARDKGIARDAANPYAERLDAAELPKLVREFYGTKTLLFDRALAESFLELNSGNRKVNRRKVAQLAAQMKSGDFENTGEPVIISREGIINNGQHRLFAVVEADAVLDMDVRFGIPRRAFTKTDTGASRSSADVLSIKGVGSGGQVASAVRLLLLYQRGLPDAVREFVSNDEVARAFDGWPDMEDVVRTVNELAFPKVVKSTPLYAVAFLASRSPQRAKLGAWLDALATGLDVGRDNAAYLLRERLMRAAEAPVGTRELLMERFALMVKSWNLFSRGESVAKKDFRWSPSGRNAEPFPKVNGARL